MSCIETSPKTPTCFSGAETLGMKARMPKKKKKNGFWDEEPEGLCRAITSPQVTVKTLFVHWVATRKVCPQVSEVDNSECGVGKKVFWCIIETKHETKITAYPNIEERSHSSFNRILGRVTVFPLMIGYIVMLITSGSNPLIDPLLCRCLVDNGMKCWFTCL